MHPYSFIHLLLHTLVHVLINLLTSVRVLLVPSFYLFGSTQEMTPTHSHWPPSHHFSLRSNSHRARLIEKEYVSESDRSLEVKQELPLYGYLQNGLMNIQKGLAVSGTDGFVAI